MSESIEFTGQQVTHRKYGVGSVKSRDGHTMTIAFREYGTRTFLYPDGFAQYLRANDPLFSEQVQRDLSVARQEQSEREQAHREHLKALSDQVVQARAAEKLAKKAAVWRAPAPRKPSAARKTLSPSK